MRRLILLLAILSMAVFVSVATTGVGSTAPACKLGWSQVVVNAPYYEAMRVQASVTAKALGCQMVFLDANDDPAKQIADIENLIAQKVNGILVNPITPYALTSAIKHAVAAKIPVVSVDRELYGDYVSYVGIDQWKAGQLQGEFLGKFLKGQGAIVELAGDPGDSAGMGRGGGLRQVFYAKYPGIRILQTYIAHYNEQEGKKVTQDAITSFRDKINLVYAHNDAMALGAMSAIRDAGLKIPVAAVDGQKQAYEEMMKPGSLYVSTVVNNPAEITDRAVRIMVDHLSGKAVPKKVITGTILVTKGNVKQFFKSDSVF